MAAKVPEAFTWERAERHLRMIVMMVVVLGAAATVSMWTTAGPPKQKLPDGWSPYGYTLSLALMLFPLLALGIWFWGHRKHFPLDSRALGYVLLVVGPLWIAIDVFLAGRFFEFPNQSAHIYRMFWGWDWEQGKLTKSIPYEEFAFYLGAVFVTVLLYLWASHVWYDRYTRPADDYRQLAERTPPLVEVYVPWAVLAAVALGVGLVVKKWVGNAPDDWPEYFMLLWMLGTLPTVLLARRLSPFLNDRALLYSVMATVLVSLLWEVTLALPNGWWNYRPEHMLGVPIGPWSGLPIEATSLWPISAWSNVLLFELFRVKLYSRRPWRELLFGWRPAE